MSYMAPDMPQDEMPPEQMNGGPPEEEKPGPEEAIECCLNGIYQNADKSAGSNDPEAAHKHAQAAALLGETLEKLMPQKPSPDAQLREEGESIRHAATLKSQEERDNAKRAHDTDIKTMEIASQEKQAQRQERIKVERDGKGNATGYVKEK